MQPGDVPNYSSYSLSDLYDVRQRINREKFPDRYERVIAEIERREASGASEVEQRQERRATHIQNARQAGIIFSLISVMEFCYFVVEPTVSTIKSRTWRSVPCVTFHEKKGASQARLIYQYTLDGETYTGQRLCSTESSRHWLQEYRDGEAASCLVNPDAPQESVLTREWSALLLFFVAHSSGMFIGGIHFVRHPERVRLNGKWIEE